VSLGDQSTAINFKLTSSFGGAVSNRVDKYLHNFKRLIENSSYRRNEALSPTLTVKLLPGSDRLIA
jgi:hypothetical protein